MATDNYPDNDPERLQTPAVRSFAITPHDTNALTEDTRALYVGGAGTVVMKLTGDSSSVSFVGVPAGAILPVRARVVLSTGTTATSIVGLA